MIVRELARRHSNHRAEASLDAMLRRYGISGIAGIDTRRLTRLLRDTGAMPGAFGTADEATLRAAAAAEPGTDGIDLVAEVTTPQPYTRSASGDRLIVAYDFGIKRSILRSPRRARTVEVVPASTTAAEVLAPRARRRVPVERPGRPGRWWATRSMRSRELLGEVPIFGICLGHQLLGRALGGATFKLPFGHHGGNHPVRHVPSGRVEITSQNHNFCVDPVEPRRPRRR